MSAKEFAEIFRELEATTETAAANKNKADGALLNLKLSVEELQ